MSSISQKTFANDTDLATVQAVFVAPKGRKNPVDAIQLLRTTELTKDYQDLYGAMSERPALWQCSR